jgi:hypothetical protein
MSKEMDINEMIISVGVDSEVIDKVLKGEITHLLMDINEDNQTLLLENFDGNLVLTTDELPETFHGCYFYNNGEFPYAIKDTVTFLELNSSEDYHCLLRIIDIDVEAGMRFNYQGAGKPIMEDPDGDSCVWKLGMEVVPVPAEPKVYLMRWNPAISSFTEKDYEECVENMVHGMFRMNWSIREWEEARRGDFFYMLRTGDDKAGVVFSGQFISDPYPGDDWAGSTKRRMYVDMICTNPVEPGAKPSLSLERLQKEIPAFDWVKGHSGALLSDEIAAKLMNCVKKRRRYTIRTQGTGQYLNAKRQIRENPE